MVYLKKMYINNFQVKDSKMHLLFIEIKHVDSSALCSVINMHNAFSQDHLIKCSVLLVLCDIQGQKTIRVLPFYASHFQVYVKS